MREIVMTVIPSVSQTQVLVTDGAREVMRAVLAAPYLIVYDTALPQLATALAQVFDAQIRVALCAGVAGSLSCLGLTDALGRGRRSVFHKVEVISPETTSGCRRLRGVGDFRYAHRVRRLALELGGQR